MDTFTIIVIIVAILVVALLTLPSQNYGSGKPRPFQRPPAPTPIRTRRERLQRRRRNSGGFYPCDYDGPYENDEEMVDYAIWSGILSALNTKEMEQLGSEYGAVEGMTEHYMVNDIDNDRIDEHPHPVEAEYFETLAEEPSSSSGWGSSNDSDDGGWDNED